MWTLAYGGAILRFINLEEATSLDVGDGAGSQRFEPIPWRRDTLEAQSDLQVDQLVVEMPNAELLVQYSTTTERCMLGDLIRNGVFDNAMILVYLLNLDTNGLMRHSLWEVVGSPGIGRATVSLQLQSSMGRALRKSPRTLVQEQCNNSLFDAVCGLSRALWVVSGSAINGTRNTMTTPLVNPEHYFELGQVTFTTGPNVGAARTVVRYRADGSFVWAVPLRYVVTSGDRFEAVPGCNKTTTMCGDPAGFNNLARYRGFPSIPSPETLF